jgi:hypothetical protein
MNAASAFLSASLSSGKLEIPSSQLVDFFAKLKDVSTPPVPYIIERQSISGEAQKDHVALKLEFVVSILKGQEEWCCIGLLDSSVTITSVKVEGPEASFGLIGGRHSLMAKSSGQFQIRIEAACAYTSDKNCGVRIGIPQASRTELDFLVPTSGLDLTVTPCVARELQSSDTGTMVRCSLPPTASVSVQWTVKQVRALCLCVVSQC